MNCLFVVLHFLEMGAVLNECYKLTCLAAREKEILLLPYSTLFRSPALTPFVTQRNEMSDEPFCAGPFFALGKRTQVHRWCPEQFMLLGPCGWLWSPYCLTHQDSWKSGPSVVKPMPSSFLTSWGKVLFLPVALWKAGRLHLIALGVSAHVGSHFHWTIPQSWGAKVSFLHLQLKV